MKTELNQTGTFISRFSLNLII